MKVAGFDPSLQSFGWAVWPSGETGTWAFPPHPFRLSQIYLTVETWLEMQGVDLVAIEGYAYGKAFGRETLAELGAITRLACERTGVPYLDIAPTSLKAWLVGGKATKTEVQAVVRRWVPRAVPTSDEADALGLASIAAAVVGLPHPHVPAERSRARLQGWQTQWEGYQQHG